MALSNLFTLMTQCGLEYPCFYEMLLVSCLKCLLLPAYLAAAFAKKLSRLALPVLPAVALVIVAPIHDLFQWHPTMNCLVHRLLVSFLKSPLLAAAFGKKLSPLALSVLPAGALVIVAPIRNLLRHHSSITCLVHKESIKKTVTRTRSLLQPHHLLRLLLLLSASVLSATVPVARGEVGTASYFGPPYDRTECYGEGSSQFPESNLFAAVGDGLWDLGAACGREYEVRCISKAQSGPGHCKPGASTIRVKVVDYALSVESSAAAPRQSVTGADLVLSQAAFEAIANPSVASISVEFKEL